MMMILFNFMLVQMKKSVVKFSSREKKLFEIFFTFFIKLINFIIFYFENVVIYNYMKSKNK